MRIVGFESGFRERIPEYTDTSRIRMQVSCNEFHECCFSSSTRPNKSCLFSLLYIERKILEYFCFIVAIGDVFDFDVFLFWSEGFSSGISLEFWWVFKSGPKFLYIREFFRKIFVEFCGIKKKSFEDNNHHHNSEKVTETKSMRKNSKSKNYKNK